MDLESGPLNNKIINQNISKDWPLRNIPYFHKLIYPEVCMYYPIFHQICSILDPCKTDSPGHALTDRIAETSFGIPRSTDRRV